MPIQTNYSPTYPGTHTTSETVSATLAATRRLSARLARRRVQLPCFAWILSDTMRCFCVRSSLRRSPFRRRPWRDTVGHGSSVAVTSVPIESIDVGVVSRRDASETATARAPLITRSGSRSHVWHHFLQLINKKT